MKHITDLIEEQRIFETYSNYTISNLLNRLNKSLLIWSSSGLSSLSYLFEQSKYNFDNCDDVVEKIVKKLYDLEIKKQTIEFDFDNVFFNHLILNIDVGPSIIGDHKKKQLKNKTISFDIQILNKPIDEYILKEHRRLRYIIIHELTHAYEDFLLKQDGNENGIFYPEDSKEFKRYNNAVKWILSGREMPQLKEEIILCGYYLDDHEKFAYLGTVKETVKNVVDKIIPTYKDLKFNEIIKMFEDEFNWISYLKISAFIDNIKKNKDDKNLRYKIWRLYNSIYEDDVPEDNIIEELIDKWEDFQKEFEYAFVEGYADCEENFKLEGFIDLDFSNRIYG